MEFAKYFVGIILLLSTASAADFCALEVNVTNGRGEPITAPVRLLDPRGKLVFEGDAVEGTARICDFGLGYHQLKVGPETCDGVTISRVYLEYGRTQHLKVVVNDCSREYTILGCPVYLRIANADGKRLGNTSIQHGSKVVKADGYGRVWFLLGRDEEEQVSIRREGYEPVSRSFACREIKMFSEGIVLQPVSQK